MSEKASKSLAIFALIFAVVSCLSALFYGKHMRDKIDSMNESIKTQEAIKERYWYLEEEAKEMSEALIAKMERDSTTHILNKAYIDSLFRASVKRTYTIQNIKEYVEKRSTFQK